jgi:serine/threonine-protein kinase RsbT
MPGQEEQEVDIKNCPVINEIHVSIGSDSDIVTARQRGRALVAELGFSITDTVMVATSISELARNIVLYAGRGEIVLGVAVNDLGKRGVVVVARDEGPGIDDVGRAMRSGYSTSGSLGLGLPGVNRLMDEFQILSVVGKGTVITAKKWTR